MNSICGCPGEDADFDGKFPPGDVDIDGNLDVTGDINAGGDIIAAGKLQQNDEDICIGPNSNAIDASISIGSRAGANGTQANNVLIGHGAGDTMLNTAGTNSVCVGAFSCENGYTNGTTAVGYQAGRAAGSGGEIVMIGKSIGTSQPIGTGSVCIGSDCCAAGGGANSVSIGRQCNSGGLAGTQVVNIGRQVGQLGSVGAGSVVIGDTAAKAGCGSNNVLIGRSVSRDISMTESSIIVIDATNSPTFNYANGANRCYMAPIRQAPNEAEWRPLSYDTTTREIVAVNPNFLYSITSNKVASSLGGADPYLLAYQNQGVDYQGGLSRPAGITYLGQAIRVVVLGTIQTIGNNENVSLDFVFGDGVTPANDVVLASTGNIILQTVTSNDNLFRLSLEFTARAIGGPGVATLVTAGSFEYAKDNDVVEGNPIINQNNTTYNTTVSYDVVNIKANWVNPVAGNTFTTFSAIINRDY